MKTFSRLSLFTLLFLGIAFMLAGDTVLAQDSLEVYTLGTAAEYGIGDLVEVTFVVEPDQAVNLQVTWQGVSITSIEGATAPFINGGNYAATIVPQVAASLEVKGRITAAVAWIKAKWDRRDADDLSAQADFISITDAPRIVVDPPNVNGTGLPSPLKVGDTFTQEIWARDFLPPIITDLSAWQMNITYNPQILQFVSATEGSRDPNVGNFLGGANTLFMATGAGGTIKAHQARISDDTVPDPPVAGVTGSGVLMTVEFKLLEFAEEALGLSNIQLSNSQLRPPPLTDERSQASRASYHVVVNPVVATHRFPAVDVNRDGMVNVMDLVVIAGSLGSVPSNPRTDVNNDGFVNVLDLMAVASDESWGMAATLIDIRSANDPGAKGNAPQTHTAANVTPDTIQGWIGLLQVEDDGSAIFDLGISNLEALLASRIPTETRLLLNYPNPFNPETWIPYQLAKATDVTVTIHSMNGSLIRTLELGHQAAGIYRSKSQAAYWDGRNEFGEQVASGLYFYTLTAGDFSATHKMLVRK